MKIAMNIINGGRNNMNANELMLNDWVHHIDEESYGQVCEIREDFIKVNVNIDNGYEHTTWIASKPKKFSGIFLTTKMLKLNGWKHSGDYWIHEDIIEIRLTINHDMVYLLYLENDGDEHVISIPEVHDFQHLLRFFRYYNEANNFKIK